MKYLGPTPTDPEDLATVDYADTAGGGGGGGSPDAYVALVPAISADGSTTITHSLNNWNVDVVLTRSYLESGLTTATPGEVVSDIRWRKFGPNNIILEPSVAIAANEFIISVNPSEVPADTTGPTAGTLSSPSQGSNTVDLSLSGGTDAGIGLAGVNWYREVSGTPTLIGQGASSTFTDTGRSPATSYVYTAKRYDYYGTEGTVSNTLTQATLTPVDVAPIGTAVQNRSASGAVSVTPTYASGSLRLAVAIVSVSHTQWVSSSSGGTPTTNYSLVVSGSQSGGWTRYIPPSAAAEMGTQGGQPSGGPHIFYKVNPSTSWTTDSVSFTPSGSAITPVNSCITIQQFSNVDQSTPLNGIVVDTTSTPLSIGISSASGDYTVLGYCMSGNTAATTYNKTQIGSTQGASSGIAGHAWWLHSGMAAAGAGGTITHTWTGGPSAGTWDGAVLVNINKA
jgi:hypothetical protein